MAVNLTTYVTVLIKHTTTLECDAKLRKLVWKFNKYKSDISNSSTSILENKNKNQFTCFLSCNKIGRLDFLVIYLHLPCVVGRTKRRRRPSSRKLPSSSGWSIREKYRQFLENKGKTTDDKLYPKQSENTQEYLPHASMRISSSEIKETSLISNRYLDDKGQVRIKSDSGPQEQVGRRVSVIQRNPSRTSSSSRVRQRGVSGRRKSPAPPGKSNRGNTFQLCNVSFFYFMFKFVIY